MDKREQLRRITGLVNTTIGLGVLLSVTIASPGLAQQRKNPESRQGLSDNEERAGRYRVSQECMRELQRLGRPVDRHACRIREPWWRRLMR